MALDGEDQCLSPTILRSSLADVLSGADKITIFEDRVWGWQLNIAKRCCDIPNGGFGASRARMVTSLRMVTSISPDIWRLSVHMSSNSRTSLFSVLVRRIIFNAPRTASTPAKRTRSSIGIVTCGGWRSLGVKLLPRICC